MKSMAKLYVCGRCGYRSNHRMKCPSCGFHLEDECVKCYSAKGNCVCRFHGVFASGRHVKKLKKRKAAKNRLKGKK
ncbi:hypothetical protein HYV83_02860 [Candidatus Woesearchaeota archaeon]|nr:hypothetical protein [Candidatus Woesearchaeota archaeon]